MNDRPTVVVVEDDVEMNALERELLDVHGLGAIPAYTGAEAVEASVRWEVHAILLDVMLPGMDGFEACRRVKSITKGSIPVVLVTALDSEECRRRGHEAGADAYFVKPFDPDEIVRTLRTLIARAGQGR